MVLSSGGLLASVARGMDPILCEDVNGDERYDPEVAAYLAYLRACIHMSMCVCMYVCIHVRVFLYVCMHVCVCMCERVILLVYGFRVDPHQVFTHSRACVCVCVCIYTHMRM